MFEKHNIEVLANLHTLTPKAKNLLYLLIVNNNKSFTVSELIQGLKIDLDVNITRYYAYELLDQLENAGLVKEIPVKPKKVMFDPLSIQIMNDRLKEEIMRVENLATQISLDNPLLKKKRYYSFFKKFYSIFEQNIFEISDIEGLKAFDSMKRRKIRKILSYFESNHWLIKKKRGIKNNYSFFTLKRIIDIEAKKELNDKEAILENLRNLNTKLPNKHVSSLKSVGAESKYENDSVLLIRGHQVKDKLKHYMMNSKTIQMARFIHEKSLVDEDLVKKITNNILPILELARSRGTKIEVILPIEVVTQYSKILFSNVKFPNNRGNLEIRISNIRALPFDIFDKNAYFEYLGITRSSCLLIKNVEAVKAKKTFFKEIWNESEKFKFSNE